MPGVELKDWGAAQSTKGGSYTGAVVAAFVAVGLTRKASIPPAKANSDNVQTTMAAYTPCAFDNILLSPCYGEWLKSHPRKGRLHQRRMAASAQSEGTN